MWSQQRIFLKYSKTKRQLTGGDEGQRSDIKIECWNEIQFVLEWLVTREDLLIE